MIELHKHFQGNDKIKMIIQVHDELVFEIHQDYVNEYAEIIKGMMEKALPVEYQSKINLLVDIGIGHNWAEAH